MAYCQRCSLNIEFFQKGKASRGMPPQLKLLHTNIVDSPGLVQTSIYDNCRPFISQALLVGLYRSMIPMVIYKHITPTLNKLHWLPVRYIG
jgi:hypothetical protein